MNKLSKLVWAVAIVTIVAAVSPTAVLAGSPVPPTEVTPEALANWYQAVNLAGYNGRVPFKGVYVEKNQDRFEKWAGPKALAYYIGGWVVVSEYYFLAQPVEFLQENACHELAHSFVIGHNERHEEITSECMAKAFGR